jgi:hypothetical protein
MSHDDVLDQLAQYLSVVSGDDVDVFLDALADSGLDLSTMSVDDLDELYQNVGGEIPDGSVPDVLDQGSSVTQPMFSGYRGSYGGITDAWYSSDGYVYDPAGNRIGTH